jgi:hypothetical protein
MSDSVEKRARRNYKTSPVKLAEQIDKLLNSELKLKLTKSNVRVFLELLDGLGANSQVLSSGNMAKLQSAGNNNKPCILMVDINSLVDILELAKSNTFDGRGFGNQLRSGLKSGLKISNSLAKAGGYKNGIADAVLSNTVGKMVPGSEGFINSASRVADRGIRGMGFMNNLKKGVRVASKVGRVANNISEDMGYSLSDMAMDKANEYIPEEYQPVTNAIGKYAKKRLSGGAVHNPYMPQNIRGGSLDPSYNGAEYINNPIYTGADDSYFERPRGRGFRSY